VEGGHAHGIPVAVCGEMAGDPSGAMALAGLGIDELSMDAGAFGGVKRAVASATREQLADAVARAMAVERAGDARAIFDELRGAAPAT